MFKCAAVFSGMNNREVLDQVDRGYRIPKPFPVTDSLYEQMLNCWHKVSEKRPTFEFLYMYLDDFFVNTEPNYVEPNPN